MVEAILALVGADRMVDYRQRVVEHRLQVPDRQRSLAGERLLGVHGLPVALCGQPELPQELVALIGLDTLVADQRPDFL